MLPLSDTEPNRYGLNLPAMTIAVIGANLVVAWLEYGVLRRDPGQFDRMLGLYGAVPQLILSRQAGGALSSLTSTFMHGGPLHLIGNMYFLWIFGRRVEDACGPWRFLLFYLTAGVCGDIVSTLGRAGSLGPSIGASGAISGVMGAYLVLYPGGRIRTLVFLWFIPLFPKVRAFWFLLYWLGTQLLATGDILLTGARSSTNYWAHLGGFFSCFFIFLFLRPEAFTRYLNDVPV